MSSNGQIRLLPEVESFLRKSKGLLINGVWKEAMTGETFAVENPANADTLTSVSAGAAADIDDAVSAARTAFDQGPWKTMTPSDRSKLIMKLADLMEKHADELAQLESLDNGKAYSVAKAADVPLAVDVMRYMAGWTTKLTGETIPLSVPYTPDSQYLAYTQKEAVGVVGQIIPWNFPLLMAAWKLAPALATGCTVVLKPAEQTPLTALRLGELIIEAGIPKGVVNIVTGFPEAGAALAAHPQVDKVAFTGSTEVGKLIVAAAKGNLKKVSLELGGKSPNIIFNDANLDMAIPGAASAIFFNHGQCCCAGSRLYVQSSVYEQVVEGVKNIAETIKLGDGFDQSTQMGPLVSREQMDRVCQYVRSGQEQGAEVLSGGKRHGDQGYFVEPTILANTNSEMKVVKEEIFGPVVTVMPFDDWQQVVDQANDSSFGLAAGIWTKDLSKAHLTSKALKAGTTWINCYNVFDAAMPFGGYKESGWGREMGKEVLDLYTQTKSVCISL